MADEKTHKTPIIGGQESAFRDFRGPSDLASVSVGKSRPLLSSFSIPPALVERSSGVGVSSVVCGPPEALCPPSSARPATDPRPQLVHCRLAVGKSAAALSTSSAARRLPPPYDDANRRAAPPPRR
jgi:hypothetical protein